MTVRSRLSGLSTRVRVAVLALAVALSAFAAPLIAHAWNPVSMYAPFCWHYDTYWSYSGYSESTSNFDWVKDYKGYYSSGGYHIHKYRHIDHNIIPHHDVTVDCPKH